MRTTEEICESVDEYLAQQAATHREPPRSKPTTGRSQRASTRAKLSRRQFEHHRARALQEGEVSPLRALRLKQSLTIKQASRRALVSERSWARAERSPESVGAASWARIAASLKVAPADLLPAD